MVGLKNKQYTVMSVMSARSAYKATENLEPSKKIRNFNKSKKNIKRLQHSSKNKTNLKAIKNKIKVTNKSVLHNIHLNTISLNGINKKIKQPLINEERDKILENSQNNKVLKSQIRKSPTVQVNKNKLYSKIKDKNTQFKETAPQLNDIKLSKPKKSTMKNKINERKKYGTCISKSSQEIGAEKLEWMISPINKEKFFNNYWEKQVLHVKRQNKDYYKGIFDTQTLDNILKTENVEFTKNLDITSYREGVRETHNGEGRAFPPKVWDYYKKGCSVRLLNPQTFHTPVWKLLAELQEYFQSFCGANIYLTPPGTQGFAPHWDDIEAFVLQLEGKKRWRVYAPRNDEEILPRISSGNFNPDDNLGNPVLNVVLEAGDLLYFPRGFIHQGETMNDSHSLHITVSTYQKTSWADFMEKLLPLSLSTMSKEYIDYRKGLPLAYANSGGVAFSDIKCTAKSQFETKVKELLMKMVLNINSADIDSAIDQMSKGFIHDSLPPVIEKEEEKICSFGGGEKWDEKLQKVIHEVEITANTSIRLIRKGCLRLLIEDADHIRLYHSVENSREYHAEEPKYVEIYPEMAQGIEALILNYPKYIPVKSLPLATMEDKLVLATDLWDQGLLTTETPLYRD